MWVVVPVKRFSNAKTRLAPLLSAAERESLAQAMLNDVLRAIAESRRVAGVLVVSREVRARYCVERIGGLFLEDTADDLSSAIELAGEWLATHGQRGMLMAGDVPLVSGREIDELLLTHRGAPAVTLAPDRKHDGTNALAVSPADAIHFAFGKGSFAKHRQAALDVGIQAQVALLPGLALDVDNPMDLQTLLTYDSETETLAYLCDSGIARRVMPHHTSARDLTGW
ncbi:MAG: 2-phospho-L-lactate guanylyltransferase [Proteobacteria bacterium]|nr:2-phospho-L-lactate guanylyltransferase [Pseudomonadota bacterium]